MRSLFFTAMLALAAGSSAGASAASLRRVALVGDTVPGTGSVFQGFNSIVLNATGDAAVLGWMTTNEYVLVADYGAGMVLVGENGTQAPGAPPGLELSLHHPTSIADDGRVLVHAGLEQGTSGVIGHGLWLFEPGVGLTPYLRNGDPAPGMPGTLGLIGEPTTSPSGRFVFLGAVDSGPDSVSALFAADLGEEPAPFLVQGMPAPGAPPGALFAWPDGPIWMDEAGGLLFPAWLEVGPGGVGYDDALVLFGPDGAGGFTLLARARDVAPGTGGELFWGFRGGHLNRVGRAAFLARLVIGVGGVVDGVNDFGIWQADAGGPLQLLARTGDPAPGAGPGAEFRSLGDPLVDAAGRVSFLGFYDTAGGTWQAGLWRSDAAGDVALVARTGDPLPGAPGYSVASFDELVANAAGRLCTWTDVEAPGGAFDNLGAILCFSDAGAPEVVVRKGDAIAVAPGDVRIVERAATGHAGQQAIGMRALNEAGDLGLWIRFSDESEGMFVAAPEPARPLLLLIGGASLLALPYARHLGTRAASSARRVERRVKDGCP